MRKGKSRLRVSVGPKGLPLLLGFILRTVSGQPAKHPLPLPRLVISFTLGVVISHLPGGYFTVQQLGIKVFPKLE